MEKKTKETGWRLTDFGNVNFVHGTNIFFHSHTHAHKKTDVMKMVKTVFFYFK